MIYSIIKKSQLEGARRLDAEYYQPEYLELVSKIKRLPHKRLGDLCLKITDGSHQTPYYQESGVPFLMVRDIQEQQINFDQAVSFVSESFDKELKHCKPVAGDILFTKVGSVGISAVVPDDAPGFNIFVSVAVLKDCTGIDKFFLSTFLNSKFGRFQAIRAAKGITQLDLHLEDIREFLIPEISQQQQEKISKLVRDMMGLVKNSKSLYSQAEKILLEELELRDFTMEGELYSVVRLSEVKNAERMDADYFEPRYNILLSKIKKNNARTLESFIKDYSTGFPFKSGDYQEEGVPLIRINNIKKEGLDLSETAFLSNKDYLLSPKDTAKAGDIVLSMSGSIGLAALIPDNIPKCSVNQRILKISSAGIDKVFLVLLLNSIVGRYQLERIGTGGVQTNISYKDIKNILIPIMPQPTQQKIAGLVRQSHEARKKAKELLEQAKRKVEELIEQGTK